MLFFTLSCKKKQENNEAVTNLNEVFTSLNNDYLKEAANYLDSLNQALTVEKKRGFFKKSRKIFKTNESMLSFWDKENYKTINSPNLLRIYEEDPTDIKIKKPIGYQVIEENLFSNEIDTSALNSVVTVTKNKLLLVANNTKLTVKAHHLIWILRDEIIRVATTGLSNFDSPVLGQSLVESSYAYDGIIEIIETSKGYFTNQTLMNSFIDEIKAAQKALDSDFDTFNRFNFIKNHTHKQLKMLVEIQNDWKVEFPFKMALSNDLTTLFSNDIFNLTHFSDYRNDTIHLSTKIKLGQELFNDTRLSIKNDMSCATCHIKALAFTDGKATFSKHQKRNTPTLTYAGLQKAFFHDNRAGSLEGQIIGVVTNHDEFNTDLEHIVNVVKEDKAYSQAFDSLYKRGATDMNIRHAMASYVRTLNRFNSKFDNNINGKENTLTALEKEGFNIFMGKGACATCHFPPLFNGTVPPHFSESELEIIGVPDTKENKTLDNDLGRYYLFNVEERKGSFKTPTIRNIELTAPYMHNGVYETLEDVIDFYNQGGGAGLGFDVPHQTLPFDNLDLSEHEVEVVIAFMKTLTDNY